MGPGRCFALLLAAALLLVARANQVVTKWAGANRAGAAALAGVTAVLVAGVRRVSGQRGEAGVSDNSHSIPQNGGAVAYAEINNVGMSAKKWLVRGSYRSGNEARYFKVNEIKTLNSALCSGLFGRYFNLTVLNTKNLSERGLALSGCNLRWWKPVTSNEEGFHVAILAGCRLWLACTRIADAARRLAHTILLRARLRMC